MEFNYKQISTSTPIYHPQNKKICKPTLLLPCISFLLLAFIIWQLLQSSILQVIKSVSAGCLLVYYSWELIYFDSLSPGIQPPSPLSPPSIKTISGHTLHLNYALAVVIGIFFTLFVNWFA